MVATERTSAKTETHKKDWNEQNMAEYIISSGESSDGIILNSYEHMNILDDGPANGTISNETNWFTIFCFMFYSYIFSSRCIADCAKYHNGT